jgi:hypothetical protein
MVKSPTNGICARDYVIGLVSSSGNFSFLACDAAESFQKYNDILRARLDAISPFVSHQRAAHCMPAM